MQRRVVGTITACLAVIIGLLVPGAQPASAHVCNTFTGGPGWEDQKLWLVWGSAGYECDWKQTAVRVETTLERFSSRTSTWSKFAAATREAADARSVWVEAIQSCAGLHVILRSHGRGMAFYHTGYTDIHEAAGPTREFACYNNSPVLTPP